MNIELLFIRLIKFNIVVVVWLQKPGILTTSRRFSFQYGNILIDNNLASVTDGQSHLAKSGQSHWLFHYAIKTIQIAFPENIEKITEERQWQLNEIKQSMEWT